MCRLRASFRRTLADTSLGGLGAYGVYILAKKEYVPPIVELDRTTAISHLKAKIFLGKLDEKRLRTILADAPPFRAKMQAQFDLNKLLRDSKAHSDELERLLAKG